MTSENLSDSSESDLNEEKVDKFTVHLSSDNEFDDSDDCSDESSRKNSESFSSHKVKADIDKTLDYVPDRIKPPVTYNPSSNASKFRTYSSNDSDDFNSPVRNADSVDNFYSKGQNIYKRSFSGDSDDFSEPQSNRKRVSYTSSCDSITNRKNSSIDSDESSGPKKRTYHQQDDDSRPSFMSQAQSFSEDETPNFSNPRKKFYSDPSAMQDLSEESDDVSTPQVENFSGNSLNKPLNKNKGQRIMERFGFKVGEGLGKNKQGRVEPVEFSKQRGREGLGLSFPMLDASKIQWDPSMERTKLDEDVFWLEGSTKVLELETMETWFVIGPKNLKIEKMTDFVNEKLLQNILHSKTAFDDLNSLDLRKAISRANPFESLRGVIFMNRAAMKMANIDAVFNFMFSNPKDINGLPMVSSDQLLYFADVCAGPGGFSEYILWKNKWRAKGFGFTLKESNDFKLTDFYAGTPETFETYYGKRNDGNIYFSDNILSLQNYIYLSTEKKGVHIMMADGGFSVEGQENIQEILSKQLYLGQFLTALCILRTNGHFVCKLFDLFSPFSVGLIYLMYHAFHEICIFKPNTSRPANSERYIICKYKREDSKSIRDYMFILNENINLLKEKSPDEDVTHCVPMDLMTSDEKFYDYIISSNNRIGEKQILHLAKAAAFSLDPQLYEKSQAIFRKDSLVKWKIPDIVRKVDRPTPTESIKKIFPSHDIDKVAEKEALLFGKEVKLDDKNMKSSILSVYDWYCFVLGTHSQLYFYLGLGGNRVCKWVGRKWKNVENCNFELTAGTLVYGEIVPELYGEGQSQRKNNMLHIYDAITLGDENISDKHYLERINIIQLYRDALCKQNGECIRVLHPIPLEKIDKIFESLTIRISKTKQQILVVEVDDYSFQPKGLLFYNATKDPWHRYVSKKTRHFYYASPYLKESKYEKDKPIEAIATVKDCIVNQLLWYWEEGVGIQQEPPINGVLHKDVLINFIREKLSK